VRKVDLLGLLAVAVIVAAVVADEALLLFVAGALVALMFGADRPGPSRGRYPPRSWGVVRLTDPGVTVDTARMDEQREQRTEQSSEDEAQVSTGAGDDDVVVVQQGDDLVSYQGGEEVGRRPILDPDTNQQQQPDQPEQGSTSSTSE